MQSSISSAVRFAAALLLFAFSLFAYSYAAAAPGDLEQLSLLKIPGGDNRNYVVAVQPDGKILAAGYAYFGTQQFAITRYNADGTVDTSFGEAGTRLEWLGPGNAVAHGIAVQSTGKIVAGGYAVSDMSRFGIARFNSDGSLDTTFGGGGAVTSIGTGSAALAMALQSDDKIILGGWSIVSGRKVFTLARYDANAPTLDTTFGSSGVAVMPAGSSDEQILALAVQVDDKIVAAGDDGSGVTVRRYNADGSLDTSFGTSGTATFTGITGGRGVAVLSDGHILVAGNEPGTGNFEAIRLASNGALDTTFGTSGFARISGGAINVQANDLTVQSDGKILVAGTGAVTAGRAVAVARFNADGSVDTAFGSNGLAAQHLSPGSDEGNAVTVLGSGRIVLAGTSAASGAPDALVIAFTSAGALDTSFGSAGTTLVDAGSKQSGGRASVLQPDGKLVVVGYERPSPTAPSVTDTVVARYNPDGSLDTTFGTNGVATTGPDKPRAVALQSDGKIVVVGYSDGNFMGNPATHVGVSRLNPDGTVDSSFSSNFVSGYSAASATEEAYAVALQGDGKVVIGGAGQNGSFLDAMFMRLNTDGTLDTGFGTGGRTFVAMSTGGDQVNAVAVQTDGMIVGAGGGDVSSSQDSVMLTRLASDGSVDTTFGTGGVVTTSVGATTSMGNAVALQIDGKIVVGGQWFNPAGTDDFLLARYLASGAPDTSFGTNGVVTTDMGNHNRVFAIAILSNGKIDAAGQWADGFGLAQYLPSGTLDTTFGSGGTVYKPVNAGADIAYSIVARADGKLWVSGDGSGLLAAAIFTGDGGSTSTKANATVALSASPNPSSSGQSVTFTATVSGSAGTPTGTVNFRDGSTSISGCSAVALSGGTATCSTSSLSSGTHSITAAYSGDGSYNAGTSSALTQTVQTASSSGLALSPESLDFGGESMGTASPPRTITVTNTGGSSVTISGISASSQFSETNDCGTLAAGATCTVSVTFNPAPTGAPLDSSTPVSGSLTVSSNAPGSPNTAALSGSAEKSLVTHFYEAILRRAPDAGGKSFWESETSRMVGLTADVNEVWYAMAAQFFFSPEYLGLGRDNTGFVTDLYNTFFNRGPDSGGLSFWVDQLNNGMPREVVLVSFMLSPEFTSFSQGIFGNTAARAEVNVVMDFYRGLLSRLPDSGGFDHWVGQFRTAQCQGGDAVYAQVESISSSFADGPEYANRGRTNAQYVGDLYNSFLRRGGDSQGVQFWIQQLDSGAQSRDQVRQQFIASPEFTNRVNAIVDQGCMQ